MTERNKIEIDYCPSCRGVWLDKGELDKMLDYAQNPGFENPDQRDFDKDIIRMKNISILTTGLARKNLS
jgi:Zn-finger nucleic acid-binding protein